MLKSQKKQMNSNARIIKNSGILGILHSGLKVVDTFDVNKKLTTSYRSH